MLVEAPVVALEGAEEGEDLEVGQEEVGVLEVVRAEDLVVVRVAE